MKILFKDLKKGEIKISVENQDDLWYLSTIIEPRDLIKGKTLRKVKIGEEEQRKAQIVKKPVFLSIDAEKVEFSPELLRVSGIVHEGPDDIPRGSHHTFSVEINSIITIIKEKWFGYQLDKLNEAAITALPNILICILDREEAIFALSKRKGFEFLTEIKGEVEKKEERAASKGEFYKEVIKLLTDYAERYEIQYVVVASPAFWKEELIKQIKDAELKKKITQATCSSVDKSAINEVLKRPELANILKQDRTSKEIKIVEEILTEIGKDGNVAYGIKEVEFCADAGAIKMLALTDYLIKESRIEGTYNKIERIIKTTEKAKGEVHIISLMNEGGAKLHGLGGIAAILRYKTSFN
jgi:protein pelota